MWLAVLRLLYLRRLFRERYAEDVGRMYQCLHGHEYVLVNKSRVLPLVLHGVPLSMDDTHLFNER